MNILLLIMANAMVLILVLLWAILPIDVSMITPSVADLIDELDKVLTK
jgi:hypothetical protein